ncbi:MAG: hypothetical protein JXB20_05245 [Bacilli bacterium]|nr:hypothetical protein [Bacilli bacterium]
MKKTLILLLFLVVTTLIACDQETSTTTTATTAATTTTQSISSEQESPCKDDPLGTDCFIPSDDLDFISPVANEYTIVEDFESELLNQQPMNWLLYSNSEYKSGGVSAKVKGDETNHYVEMYSDGLQKPLYPQSAPTPTFIFTSKFNLDIDRSGVAYADIMVPSVLGNSVSVGVSTGAVNSISIIVDTDLSLLVKVGGPFYYYSQNGDGGDYHDTGITLNPDTWYSFRFEWDAQSDSISAYMVVDSIDTILFDGVFHISNRFNALADGEILVPNVVKVTMPYGRSGYAYLDNVSVERSEIDD